MAEAEIQWDDGRSSTGWGRGTSWACAQKKAISEAVERSRFNRLPLVRRAAAQELDRYIRPDMLVRYSSEQREMLGDLLAASPMEEEKLWALASPLFEGGQNCFVLADFLCSPRAFALSDRARLVVHASTSGCATADSIELANQRATLELLERDAFMRHWFAQRPGRIMDLASLPPNARKRFELLERLGCEVGLQCLNMGVHPTWLAWAQSKEMHFTCIGSATGLDADSALYSCLCELETSALLRAQGVPRQDLDRRAVRTPGDHGALYATPKYFRCADSVLRAEGPRYPLDTVAPDFVSTGAEIYRKMHLGGYSAFSVLMDHPDELVAPYGDAIHTVRVVAENLIPMLFGYARSPMGMDRWGRTGVRDIHPFT